MNHIRVTVWNEYYQSFAGLELPPEQEERLTAMNKEVAAVYPRGIHEAIAEFLNQEPGIKARTSVITDPDQGLSEEALDNTDVMVYWAHIFHDLVEDRFVQRLVERVQKGMGIIFLHSAHKSRAFMNLLGTSGRLSCREAEERCRVWTASPSHPIARDVPLQFALDREEMYSEPFGIPNPDDTVFISWYQGGNVFRSGVTFHRDYGKIFYFQPGHETYPNYFNPAVQKVIINAVKWANPLIRLENLDCTYDGVPLERLIEI